MQITPEDFSDTDEYINLLYIKPTVIMTTNTCKYLVGIGFDAECVNEKKIVLNSREWDSAPKFRRGYYVGDTKYELITDEKMIKKLECLLEKEKRNAERQEKKELDEKEKFKKDLKKKLLNQPC